MTVESEAGGEIETFPSIAALPPIVHDWRAGGANVAVTPDNVRVYYAPRGYEHRK